MIVNSDLSSCVVTSRLPYAIQPLKQSSATTAKLIVGSPACHLWPFSTEIVGPCVENNPVPALNGLEVNWK